MDDTEFLKALAPSWVAGSGRTLAWIDDSLDHAYRYRSRVYMTISFPDTNVTFRVEIMGRHPSMPYLVVRDGVDGPTVWEAQVMGEIPNENRRHNDLMIEVKKSEDVSVDPNFRTVEVDFPPCGRYQVEVDGVG